MSSEISEEVLSQYNAVRSKLGVLDRSAVGKIAIRGEDRFTWLQGMVSNDVRLLEEGKVSRLSACILNATGHLLSDIVLIATTGDDPYILMELPRANISKILSLLDRFIITEDVELTDVSDVLACISYQGPLAERISQQKLVWHEIEMTNSRFGGTVEVQADHSGDGGWDMYLSPEDFQAVYAHFRKNDKNFDFIGEEAQEILRVEAGIPKYGVDMDESVIALEANLGPTHISLTKGCYVGQEIIARIDSRGHTNRALTGLIIEEGDLPAFGDKIYALSSAEESEGRETGRITSVVASSPAVNGKPIALGYVRHEHCTPGNRLRVGDESHGTFATVTELPFYRKPAQ